MSLVLSQKSWSTTRLMPLSPKITSVRSSTAMYIRTPLPSFVLSIRSISKTSAARSNASTVLVGFLGEMDLASKCTLISPEVFFSATRIASTIAASSSLLRKSSTFDISFYLFQSQIQLLEQFHFQRLLENMPSHESLKSLQTSWLGIGVFRC